MSNTNIQMYIQHTASKVLSINHIPKIYNMMRLAAS